MTGYDVSKRIFDLVICGLALVFLSVPLLLVATAVRISMGAPVLFHQPRSGLHGRAFVILKFRTMRDTSETPESSIEDRERVTRLGRFLRATSIDELPELWNVVRGDMSLVGPRPLLMEYLGRYSNEQRRRHEAKPGITGWAQINGRNSLTWDQKFALDIWYVDHRSLWLDLKILALTVASLFKGGVNSSAEQTMPPFTGGNDVASNKSEES